MTGSIRVTNLGKAYKQYPTRWNRLGEWIFGGSRHRLKWILQEITFGVEPGEAMGIIGINGAGKSTLLKLITGTTQPTTGDIALTGRVAAMLELGMGFHPDFTGLQNVFMGCQLLGLSVDEITSLVPHIEEFAEIGDYINQPVRVYSSGMQMRLAFSVATAKRPDILIVDEILSVGDAYFQHKSFDLIRKFRDQGTTLLIVSHDKAAIQSICDRAILLNLGHIALEGKPDVVMDYYNAMLSEHSGASIQQESTDDGRVQTTSGSGEAVIEQVVLLNENDERVEVVNVGQVIKLKVTTRVNFDIPELTIGYMIKDRLGQPVFGTNTHHLKHTITSIKGGTKAAFTFQFAANLGEGTYSVTVALHADDSHISKNYQWLDLALVFQVINVDKDIFGGVAWLPPTTMVTYE